MSDRLLTVPQAAIIMQISKSKAYMMAKKREIPVVVLGGNIRIPEDSFKEYLASKTEFKGGGYHQFRNKLNNDDFIVKGPV